MKRWPAIAGFAMFLALCASVAYWTMQLLKPPVRPVAAPQQSAPQVVNLDAAAALFGGRKTTAVAAASNYVLKGVVVAANPRDSVAIVSVDGKPAQAIALNSDVVRGVTVKEVQPQYAVLSEGGVAKRIPLQENVKPTPAVLTPNAVSGQTPALAPAPVLAPVQAPAAAPPRTPVPLQIAPPAPIGDDTHLRGRTGRARRGNTNEAE